MRAASRAEQAKLAALCDAQFVGLPSATAPRSEVGGHPCQGLYWAPKGQRPRVALIATHYNVDFAEHYLAPYIASRGLGFLGWNTRYRGNEDLFTLEHALVDIGAGVTWLRQQGANRVLIAATHPVLTGDAMDRLRKTDVEQVIVTDTVPIPAEKLGPPLTLLSVAPLLAEAIIRVHENRSVSELFQQ